MGWEIARIFECRLLSLVRQVERTGKAADSGRGTKARDKNTEADYVHLSWFDPIKFQLWMAAIQQSLALMCASMPRHHGPEIELRDEIHSTFIMNKNLPESNQDWEW